MSSLSTDVFDLQIIIASGSKNMDRAIIGLAMALAAAIVGSKIVVFFTMEGAAFANPEEGKLKPVSGFESIQDYIQLLLNEDVRIEACTSCVENYCLTERNKDGMKIIHPGLHYTGLSTAAIRSVSTKTLIF